MVVCASFFWEAEEWESHDNVPLCKHFFGFCRVGSMVLDVAGCGDYVLTARMFFSVFMHYAHTMARSPFLSPQHISVRKRKVIEHSRFTPVRFAQKGH